MTVRSRTAVLLVGAAAASLALSACEEPTPRVLIKAGGSYASSEAKDYYRDGKSVKYDRDVPTVTVHTGDIIGVDVPREVARAGWVATITDLNGKPLPDPTSQLDTQTGHYAVFPPAAFSQPLFLLVQEQSDTPGLAKGSWLFKLVPGKD